MILFTGPSLSADEAAAIVPGATILPPVAQGDVYRAALARPRAIGIIDGYFERVPAVWHKEILWAMSQGIHVFGSASMGALRAAELAAFGMEGTGVIFEWYRDGLIEDDDEVAVAHGPAEDGYPALSEAMVNIRATLARAEEAGIVATHTRAGLERIAKETFYPERAWPSLLRAGMVAGLHAEELETLRAWLTEGRVNQKREDALAMMRRMQEFLAGDPPPKRVRYAFEHTIWWDTVVRYAGEGAAAPSTSGETITLDAVLDELRLDPEAYRRAHDGASVRHLALLEVARRRFVPPPEQVHDAATSFRVALGLFTDDAMQQWLAEHELTADQFGTLMREEAAIGRTRSAIERDVIRRLPDHLRVSGRWPALVQRARAKQAALEARGLHNPALEDAGLTRGELLARHFARLGRAVPENLELEAMARGFAHEDAFVRALLREACYENLVRNANNRPPAKE